MRTLRLTSLCAALLLFIGLSVNAQTGKVIPTPVSPTTTNTEQLASPTQISTEAVGSTSGAPVTAPQTLAAPAAGGLQTSASPGSASPNTSPIKAATAPRSLAAPAITRSGAKEATAPKTAVTDLIAAATRTKASDEAVVKTQESEIATATAKLDELRQLVSDGLIARVELENAEHLLAGLRRNLENLKKNVADSERTIAELHRAGELAKAKPLMPVTASSASRSFLKPAILRYGGESGWSLGRLSAIQTFFASTFGQTLPVSAFGQSATHNRLGYNHRNAVDVPLHPDSLQGKALISFLQSQGIPYLAFRSAVAGVATGPHIHIGYPSSRT